MEEPTEVCRRKKEIFFLWLSVLCVVVGFSLTSYAGNNYDLLFMSGVISSAIGSVSAFCFVLYISFSSEFRYQKTMPVKREESVVSTEEPQKLEETATGEPLTATGEPLTATENLSDENISKELQKVEYQEVDDILNKATKMLEEFSLISENLGIQRAKPKHMCNSCLRKKLTLPRL